MRSRFYKGMGRLWGMAFQRQSGSAPAGPREWMANGTFTGNDATGWNVGNAWSDVSGEALNLHNTTGFTKTITYTFPTPPPPGTSCAVSFVVSNFVANGGSTAQALNLCGTPSAGLPLITGNGTYGPVTMIAGSGSGTFGFTERNNMNLTIDSVSVFG